MKKIKLSNELAKEICRPMLEDIEQFQFMFLHTKGGNLAIVFTRKAGGLYPLLGTYYSSEDKNGEWIPCRWSEYGQFNLAGTSMLDLEGLVIDKEFA